MCYRKNIFSITNELLECYDGKMMTILITSMIKTTAHPWTYSFIVPSLSKLILGTEYYFPILNCKKKHPVVLSEMRLYRWFSMPRRYVKSYSLIRLSGFGCTSVLRPINMLYQDAYFNISLLDTQQSLIIA